MHGTVIAICVGDKPGLTKWPAEVGEFVADRGLAGDRHAVGGPRQICVLDAAVARELAELGIQIVPGALGENLLVDGLEVDGLAPGTIVKVGRAIIEITEARRPCRSVREVDPRALKALVGHAGRMARVVSSGQARAGDPVEIVERL